MRIRPVQPSHRRPPLRQRQLRRDRDRLLRRQHQLNLQRPQDNGGRHHVKRGSPYINGSSPRALLVMLLLASGPLVQAEPPGLSLAKSQEILPRIIPPRQPQNLTIGYLTAVKGGLKDRQGLAISGAISMALDEINKDPNILPNVTLLMRWNDTKGETVEATKAMIDMICNGVVAFFGPEGSCYVEAIVAQSRNIPMISYKCSDYKASSVNTFVRTEPPDTQVTKSVIALLLHYGWNKFTIVAEKAWSTVALSLEEQAFRHNLTVNHYKTVEDRHTCCEERLQCCEVSIWFQLIQETKNMTRIYVFLGTAMSLIDMMNSMQNQKLLDNGEYMVIHVDMMTYSPREALKYLWKPDHFAVLKNCLEPKDFLKKARSLMVVVSSPPTQNYEEFTRKVREHSTKEPFNFAVPELLKKFEKYVSIHAAYLYDSVKLYARALDQLLQDQPDQTVKEIASNGTLIIETIIKKHTYQSVSGATIKLDKFGDSEGNFSVLALKKEFFLSPGNNFSCDYQMRPVGQFQQGDTIVYRPSGPMEWPGKNKPEAEPGCGFFNEHCPQTDTHNNSIIVAGLLGVMVICAITVTVSIYRKWKIEQEIEGLLWRIDLNEVHSLYHHDMMSSPSKLSLVSAISYESKCGGQVFAQTGQYRGVVVRIKELKFSKKKDISRDDMKELRILREIRHNNINSFIGACVEPMRILLLTEYCAKGSLYDIVENEDIKLDNMFITSLVHDLIKGMLYIHESPLVCHGNLKSSNCVVTSRWVLQVSDFGLHDMRHCGESGSIGEHQYYQNLLWKAPELLREPNHAIRGTQKGDVYSFAIILFEMIGRKGPYGITMDPKDIIERVKNYNPGEKDDDKKNKPFRPDLEVLIQAKAGCADYVLSTITDCWDEDPNCRPDFKTIRTQLMPMKDGTNKDIMDQMIYLMEKYATNLEGLVHERTRLLFEEKQKTEDLLHRMLPKPVANRLTDGNGVEPEAFDSVTIYFSDIVGFTAMSAESTPFEVVNFLNDLYTLFDRIIKGYDVYKVETIGDAYMVVSGLPIKNGDGHAGEIASMSLELLKAVKQHTVTHRPHETLKLRIGIHTGPVVAGVVGLTMPRYCLFGDTVNTASRMESNGESLRIHISEQCKTALDKIGGYIVEERGYVYMKGKGEVKTYWLIGATEKAVQKREVDVDDLPPLFCTPRRGQSNMLRLMADDSASQYGEFNPARQSLQALKFNASRISLAKSISAATINNVPNIKEARERDGDIKLTFDDILANNAGPIFRKNARLSTIASSSSTSDHPPQIVVRKSCSLNQFPSDMYNKQSRSPSLSWLESKKTSSWETCVKFEQTNSKTDISEGRLDNNHPNGNVIVPHTDDLPNEAEMPLLGDDGDCMGVLPIKRWHSLDQETSGPSTDSVPDKKSSARNSIRSWIVNLFNGTGLRSSEVYLGKGMERYEMQAERESIV